jgi:GMP synthase (glutamine-hydrolysing)
MILIVDCGSSKTPQIVAIFEEFCDTMSVGLHDLTEDMANKAIGLVFSGAPLLITEIDMSAYLKHLQWIKSYEKPVLGICFGHQLIGLLYGAIGSKMREDRSWQEIEIIEDSPLFHRMPDCFEMMEDHCEHISIPPEFKLMAASDACINECMQHENKAIYGVQFHPEVSGNLGNILLENFFFICEPS